MGMTIDEYDRRILNRRWGLLFTCNNCREEWMAAEEDVIDNYK